MIAPPTPWITRKVTIQASAELPSGVSPHMPEAAANMITPSVTILLVSDGVGQPAAEREQRRQRQQVGVDRPLDLGVGQAELVLDVGRRDRDDRLIDERHRDREDHRDQNQVARFVLGWADTRHAVLPCTTRGCP